MKIDGNIFSFLDINLDNVFIRDIQSTLSVAFSFKYYHESKILSADEQLTKYRNVCSVHIIKLIIDYMEEIELTIIVPE